MNSPVWRNFRLQSMVGVWSHHTKVSPFWRCQEAIASSIVPAALSHNDGHTHIESAIPGFWIQLYKFQQEPVSKKSLLPPGAFSVLHYIRWQSLVQAIGAVQDWIKVERALLSESLESLWRPIPQVDVKEPVAICQRNAELLLLVLWWIFITENRWYCYCHSVGVEAYI